MGHIHRVLGGLLIVCLAVLGGAISAAAKPKGSTPPPPEPIQQAATYPGMTTFSCRTNAIPIHPGQNLNDFSITKTCPNATKLSGPLDASVFAAGSSAEGYVTRFKPSMVELKPDGTVVTPSVWDLHLHHVVWLKNGFGPTFASGEEKTIAMSPQGYGLQVGATDNWGLNQMIHSLNASEGRQVYITWEIDWVPETTPARTDIQPVDIQWLDVAGFPQIYPVFDAERGFDLDGDGEWIFPDDVPTDPSQPGYEERKKISPSSRWRVPSGGATLIGGGGHLHPGGLYVDLEVARDGPDAGTVDGDDPAEVKQLFRSDARYYEPAGAVSWDVAMEVTPSDWRISLKGGDTVSIEVAYDVKRGSWYESMGILPLSWTTTDDPLAKDPFDDASAVQAMYDEGGILSHGRLPENIDKKARKKLKLPDPRKLPSAGMVPPAGIEIDSFVFETGGFSAIRDFPANLMRPPVVRPGETVTFTNLDALPGEPQTQQTWHSITSCRAPCNRGSGIGYPLANGPIKFDSGQLGYGQGTSRSVTTNSNTYTTPPLTPAPTGSKRADSYKRGTTYSYFCRIHPYMRGSIRVRGKDE